MLKIYLAGPDVFFSNAAVIGAAKKEICAKHGFEGVFPVDLLPTDVFSDKYTHDQQAKIVQQACVKGIRECDLLVANMTPFRGVSMDVGTAYEMGAAHIIGKKVYGYTLDASVYLKKVKDDDDCTSKDGVHYDSFGCVIEDFSRIDNCMVTEACEFIVSDNSKRFITFDLAANLEVFEKTIIKVKESLNV